MKSTLDEIALRHNFRDLGGHRTTDGQILRSGLLYRSGILPDITLSESGVIDELGIRSAFDLRSVSEQAHRRSRWMDIEGVSTRLHDQESSSADMIMALLSASDATPMMVEARMRHVYENVPDELSPVIADLLDTIGTGNTPLVFFCSFGKDRTGVVAALILDWLGVPRDEIEKDYLRSLDHLGRAWEHVLAEIGVIEPLEGMRKVLDSIMRVRSEYLSAMFEKIVRQFGSTDGYLTNGLGLTQASLRGVRHHLLCQN